MNPVRYGHPQERKRLYFLCLRADILAKAGCDREWLQSFATGLESVLAQD